MINPFASFLQPQYRSIEGAPSFGEIESIGRGRRQDAQRALENTQQNALAQRGANRADSELKLQQNDQAHRFTAEEQKQVEGLRAEYQDAEDQGDQVRLSRATQQLKRFGMDVGQKGGMDPRAEAFTGQKPKPLPGQLLPQVATKGMDPRAEAFTGGKPQGQPINEIVKTEMASRDALRARNGQEAPDLSQNDFENQLINGTQEAPSRYEEGGKTTPEYKAMLPQAPDEPEAPGGADNEKAEVVDLDKIDPTSLQIGQLPKVATAQAPQAAAPNQQPLPRLPSQLLPTVISKGGKQLYESTGTSGRWAPMVSGAFEPFTQHENPEMASAAKRAQQLAISLVGADGYAPKDAINAGREYLDKEANRISQTERTRIGSKAHVAGAAAGGAFNPKARQFYTNEMHESVQKFKNENIEAGMRGYDAGLSAINSSNPASQYDAINQLLAARSGKTVSDRERAIYDNLAGVWAGLTKKFDMAAGQQMPSEYRAQIRQLLSEAKSAVVQAREERARAAEAYHASKLRGAKPEDIQADSKAVGDAIRMGATAETSQDNSDL